ncbi:hypothetical protein IEQ34_003081 [Dendrobium chrysotoxum]|uniref:Uncharacterized protein n=1 Tax=Dendrobium chrysotoxum TaxID=161865 RepID=A0AAV7HKQ8_DENCH|nr:hypothetical protein IEQ34_003081 [Dendrobium chrysotoxum]
MDTRIRVPSSGVIPVLHCHKDPPSPSPPHLVIANQLVPLLHPTMPNVAYGTFTDIICDQPQPMLRSISDRSLMQLSKRALNFDFSNESNTVPISLFDNRWHKDSATTYIMRPSIMRVVVEIDLSRRFSNVILIGYNDKGF